MRKLVVNEQKGRNFLEKAMAFRCSCKYHGDFGWFLLGFFFFAIFEGRNWELLSMSKFFVLKIPILFRNSSISNPKGCGVAKTFFTLRKNQKWNEDASKKIGRNYPWGRVKIALRSLFFSLSFFFAFQLDGKVQYTSFSLSLILSSRNCWGKKMLSTSQFPISTSSAFPIRN